MFSDNKDDLAAKRSSCAILKERHQSLSDKPLRREIFPAVPPEKRTLSLEDGLSSSHEEASICNITHYSTFYSFQLFVACRKFRNWEPRSSGSKTNVSASLQSVGRVESLEEKVLQLERNLDCMARELGEKENENMELKEKLEQLERQSPAALSTAGNKATDLSSLFRGLLFSDTHPM